VSWEEEGVTSDLCVMCFVCVCMYAGFVWCVRSERASVVVGPSFVVYLSLYGGN